MLDDLKPAACRQARGCWRLDDREVVRRLSRTNGGNAAGEEDLEVEGRRGFPTADGGWSPEVVFLTGARDVKRRL
jgi:hypothetical protein